MRTWLVELEDRPHPYIGYSVEQTCVHNCRVCLIYRAHVDMQDPGVKAVDWMAQLLVVFHVWFFTQCTGLRQWEAQCAVI